jgi:hypothetical protein
MRCYTWVGTPYTVVLGQIVDIGSLAVSDWDSMTAASWLLDDSRYRHNQRRRTRMRDPRNDRPRAFVPRWPTFNRMRKPRLRNGIVPIFAQFRARVQVQVICSDEQSTSTDAGTRIAVTPLFSNGASSVVVQLPIRFASNRWK